MGRGSQQQAVTAQNLLFGRRRLGSGPQVASGYGLDDLIAALDKGRVPAWLAKLVPTVALASSPSVYKHINLPDGERIHNYSLSGLVAGSEVDLTYFRDQGRPHLSLSYELLDPTVGNDLATPGGAIEGDLIRALGHNISEPTVLEFSTVNSAQLRSLFNAYGGCSFRLGSATLASQMVEADHLANLVARLPARSPDTQLIANSTSLASLMADPAGREALIAANRHDTLYLDIDLHQFIEEMGWVAEH